MIIGQKWRQFSVNGTFGRNLCWKPGIWRNGFMKWLVSFLKRTSKLKTASNIKTTSKLMYKLGLSYAKLR